MAVQVPSQADEDDIRAYTSGDSHTLAVALHRRFGWRMLVVTDARDPYWRDPVNPEDEIPCVVHVYALDERGDAWDIRGKRHRESVRDDCYEFFNVLDFNEEICDDEDDLAFYVGVWSDDGTPIERPLPYYSEQDLAVAEAVIVRTFPNIPVALIEAMPSQPKFPR
jgi:hypothetical protein